MKRLVVYTLRVHRNIVLGLILAQIAAILVAIFIETHHTSQFIAGDYFISINTYTSDSIISVTFIWALIISTHLARSEGRSILHVLVVTNKLRHCANALIFVLLSLFAGVTAYLGSYIVNVGVILRFGVAETFIVEPFQIVDSLHSVVAITLYTLFILTIGYTFSTIISRRWHRISISILIGVGLFIYISLMLFVGMTSETSNELTGGSSTESVITKILFFYLKEQSIFIFSLKIMISCLILLLMTLLLTSRREAR